MVPWMAASRLLRLRHKLAEAPNAEGTGHFLFGGQPGPQSAYHEWKRGAEMLVFCHFTVRSGLDGFPGIKRYRHIND